VFGTALVLVGVFFVLRRRQAALDAYERSPTLFGRERKERLRPAAIPVVQACFLVFGLLLMAGGLGTLAGIVPFD